MHVYCDQPLTRQIRWTILNGASPVADYTETPRVVLMSDSMQYARLIGSSSYLVPLAAEMPTSMAGAIGFVDKKYSLVALEEDALPAAVAQLFETQGVPELNREDIISAPGEQREPVADWLKANPPQSMSRPIYNQGLIRYTFEMEDMVAGGVIPLINNKAIVPNAAVNGQVLVMPAAGAVYSVNAGNYPDYEAVLATNTAFHPIPLAGSDILIVKNGRLFINADKFGGNNQGNEVHIAVYTCSGKKVGVWNVAVSKLSSAPITAKLAQGAYIARISYGATSIVQRIFVK